jgi:hypothetical protein
MRRLSDVYARCNFCIVERKFFEQAIQEEVWRNAMEEEIKMIEKLWRKKCYVVGLK